MQNIREHFTRAASNLRRLVLVNFTKNPLIIVSLIYGIICDKMWIIYVQSQATKQMIYPYIIYHVRHALKHFYIKPHSI